MLPTTAPLATTQVKPYDPAMLGFPPMLPYELALRVAPVPDICAAYAIDFQAFSALCDNAAFVKAVQDARDEIKKDGASFRVKAKLQAEALLEKSWLMIHADETPNTIKADLIKSTIRWAGYEPKNTEGGGAANANAFQININLGG